jgi:hypothetical protein
MLMIDKLEFIWKGVVTASFKVLYQHLPGEIDENYEKLESG